MTAVPDWQDEARAALAAYPLAVTRMALVEQGLVNLTVAVESEAGGRYALQRLHPVFGPEVNVNLAEVTAHLATRGLVTPRLLPARDGAPGVTIGGRVWRVLTWIDGRACDRLQGPGQAAAAGALLARFHLALDDCRATLASTRPPVHDYPRHRAHLDAAIAASPGHRLAVAVQAARRVLDAGRATGSAVPPSLPRVVHGDPKLSNLLFTPDLARGVCLIDLDTLARMPLALELGDALRSWCNPLGEDAAGAHFDLGLFAAALAGYAGTAGDFIRPAEIAGIVPATHQIYLELAARFLADALEERYFGWDGARYPGRGEHNLARAQAQLAAAASLANQRADAVREVERAFCRAGP